VSPELLGALIFVGSMILTWIGRRIQVEHSRLKAEKEKIEFQAKLDRQKHEHEMLLAQKKSESDLQIARALADAEVEKSRLREQMQADKEQFILDTARKDQDRVALLEGRVDTLSGQLMELINRRSEQERVIGVQEGKLLFMQESLSRQEKELSERRERQQSRHTTLNNIQARLGESEEHLAMVIAERDRLRGELAATKTEVDLLLQQIPSQVREQVFKPPVNDGDAGTTPATGSTYEGVNIPASFAATNTLVERPVYPPIQQETGA
jgi:hypothetical protein